MIISQILNVGLELALCDVLRCVTVVDPVDLELFVPQRQIVKQLDHCVVSLFQEHKNKIPPPCFCLHTDF